MHVEGFGLVRSFNAHLNGAGNNSATGYGYGGSIVAQIIPGLLDAEFSGIGGKGIGRYGSAGLPDVTFSADGQIHPLNEFMLLGGATLHATKMLDIYAYAGEEQENRKILPARSASACRPPTTAAASPRVVPARATRGAFANSPQASGKSSIRAPMVAPRSASSTATRSGSCSKVSAACRRSARTWAS